MTRAFRYLALGVVIVSVGWEFLVLIFLLLASYAGLSIDDANQVYKDLISLKGLTNLLIQALIELMLLITLIKLFSKEKDYIIFAALAYIGGYVLVTAYRLYFVTEMQLDVIDLRNIPFYLTGFILVLPYYLVARRGELK